MRFLISLSALLAFAAISLGDGWVLKAPFVAKAKSSWKMSVHVNVNGEDHDATFTQTVLCGSKDEKSVKEEVTWADVLMDGADTGQELPAWKVSLNNNGSIVSADDGTDYARMLAPINFVYPEKEVKVGDKWTSKFKPAPDAKDMTFDYEVVEQVKVGEVDTFKIKAKLTEDGPMKGDNIYWVSKEGKVVKFELDLKNWIVPFAGPEMDAKIKGELVK